MKKLLLLLLLVCSSALATGTSGWNYTTYYGGGPSPSINNRTVDTTGVTTSINYNSVSYTHLTLPTILRV